MIYALKTKTETKQCLDIINLQKKKKMKQNENNCYNATFGLIIPKIVSKLS